MREMLATLLADTAESDARFLVLSGDHGYALFDAIRAKRPNQFLNVGVAEQNMIGVAAGLTKVGFRPCVYGLAAFVPMRVLEQIKLDLCHGSAPVILLGDGAGLVYSTLGVSHQCGEDVACLRSLPHITIYSPCDEFELSACWQEARAAANPSYIRIGKADRPRVHSAPLHNSEPIWTHSPISHESNCLIISTGSLTSVATRVAQACNVPCVSAPRITPLPDSLVAITKAHDAVAVVEEHVLRGGLFSSLAEAVVQASSASTLVSLSHFGLKSEFTTTAGSYDNALAEHGLSDDLLYDALFAWCCPHTSRQGSQPKGSA